MMPRTYSIQTLGCKVNQYEGEQIAALLRSRGLTPAEAGEAELRVVHTCSITMQAASKSRQLARRSGADGSLRIALPQLAPGSTASTDQNRSSTRTVVTGCWATSDPDAAGAIPGVDAVLGHDKDIAVELEKLLDSWRDNKPIKAPAEGTLCSSSKQIHRGKVNVNPIAGAASLPLLDSHQSGRQRAHLKVQDGCDAHCTYCIIPSLRSTLWSKPVDDAVNEANRLVQAGHVEIVLSGIFLGAYGRATALHRRQSLGEPAPLAGLVDALCTSVPGLRRLRLSSLEPGDLTDDLLAALRAHEQVVPHFHLPLQSGSDLLLRRMNRQYGRDDFLRMVDRLESAYDRPALTTDIIVGFPGESETEFDQTLQVVDHARFIHIHAFSYSARPGTAAARWTQDYIHGPVVNDRIHRLRERYSPHSLQFRRQFIGETVELLVEHDDPETLATAIRHGRCERYFDVTFEDASASPGDFVRARIDSVDLNQTLATRLEMKARGAK